MTSDEVDWSPLAELIFTDATRLPKEQPTGRVEGPRRNGYQKIYYDNDYPEKKSKRVAKRKRTPAA